MGSHPCPLFTQTSLYSGTAILQLLFSRPLQQAGHVPDAACSPASFVPVVVPSQRPQSPCCHSTFLSIIAPIHLGFYVYLVVDHFSLHISRGRDIIYFIYGTFPSLWHSACCMEDSELIFL